MSEEWKADRQAGLDVGQAIRFVFDDEQWVGKIGIGALISLLSVFIIPIPLLVGWSVGTTRNVMEGEPRPMPPWEDWGRLFTDGLSVIAAQFVYTLPFFLLLCIAGAGTGLLTSAADRGSDALAGLSFATIGLVACLAFLFALALVFLSPAIIVQYVRTNDFGACFRFGEVAQIARDNIGDILIVVLVSFAIGLVISAVTGILSIIPCLGWIAALVIGVAAGPYVSALSGHLYGQIAAKTRGKMGYVG